HVNFQLRGEESEADAHFVQQLAARWGVPFHTARLDAADHATEQGISIQMAARRLRYRWFGEICARHGYARVALAHHLDDAVETLLLHLARGTGLRGLAQVLPARPGAGAHEESWHSSSGGYDFIRPLSGLPRAVLRDYALQHRIAWREDSSNASDDYARNFVRHRILPLFEELNPNFLHTAERTLHQLAAAQANLDALSERYFEGEEMRWEKCLLRQLPQPQHALQERLRPYGFHADQVRQVAEHLDQVGFSLQAESGWRILSDRSHLLLSPPSAAAPAPHSLIQENDLMVPLPPDGRLLLLPMPPAPPYPDGREAVLVDAARLHFPLSLRPWQAGDWFMPFGMGGKRQKLQDFFVNQKLTRIDKEQVWVLENGDGAIIWVLGHRLDERFRVSADTAQALKIGLA
ncbi:MAG TPA: tRNA lysidine(34) synthetase TilS, partial [Saprospiraceae bacterium]|nr:tRNA lysidine(34) synthetase TilS [Saprospiraceae bacterium]